MGPNYKTFGITSKILVARAEAAVAGLNSIRTQLAEAYKETGIEVTPQELDYKVVALGLQILTLQMGAQNQDIGKGFNA